MRIICGTDFTESARHAATVAATLAARSEDTVLLVPSLEGGGAGAISGAIYDSLCALTHEQLQTEAERLRGLGATVKTELLTDFVAVHVDSTPDEQARLGFPGPAPFDANEPQVQLCMATHGRSRLAAALSGSVTQTVMRRSRRPLLVIHDPPL